MDFIYDDFTKQANILKEAAFISDAWLKWCCRFKATCFSAACVYWCTSRKQLRRKMLSVNRIIIEPWTSNALHLQGVIYFLPSGCMSGRAAALSHNEPAVLWLSVNMLACQWRPVYGFARRSSLCCVGGGILHFQPGLFRAQGKDVSLKPQHFSSRGHFSILNALIPCKE